MQDKWSQHAGLPLPATTSSSHPAMRYLSRLPIATLYLTMAIISTFVTKILIVRSEYKFTYPYVVDVIQLTVALLFMAATKRFFKLQNSMGNSWIAAKTVVPVSILYAAMMIIQPKFLTHIPFTSYPLYYALSIPISALYCHAKKIWLVELSTLALSGVYILGVWLASLTTTASTSSSKTGFLLGIMYAGLISAYGIQIKKKLEQLDIWSLLFWKMAIVLPVMCIVTLFSGELSRLSTVMFLDEAGFWLQMVLTGLMGLATAFALILLINETSSPVYQAFAINAKITAQSIVAAFVFHNPMSGTASFGTLVALAASLVALQNSCRLIENTHRAA